MRCTTIRLSERPCCGIIGVIGTEPDCADLVHEGLLILQNRGYDSAGIVTIGPCSPPSTSTTNAPSSEQSESETEGESECHPYEAHELFITKYASRARTDDALALLARELPKHEGHLVGVGHTRWATHGGKTDQNAHPHADHKDRIAVVHNGVIDNYSVLKSRLLAQQIQFRSETDTEVIAQLIGSYLDQSLSFVDSVRSAVGELEGTWGLVVVSRLEPDMMIACRNGSPLLVGMSERRSFVASEAAAFARYTSRFIEMKNNEILVLSSRSGMKFDAVSPDGIGGMDPAIFQQRVQVAPQQTIELSPAPFPHWTMKEIHEQPLALHRSLNYGGRIEDDENVKLGGLETNSSWLLEIKNLIIVACGTSYFSGLFGAKLFRLMRSFDSVRVVDAAELDLTDIPLKDAGVLAISQSGETRDVMRCLNLAQDSSVPIFSIVNRVGSQIARTTNCGVYINAGREMGVASTKAFSCQVAVLALIAIWFSQNRGTGRQFRRKLVASLHRLPTTFGMVIRKVSSICRDVARYLLDQQSCFVLGRGLGEPIAREGALKIKEITYCHAESYSTGALKHGPFALLDVGVPVILLVFGDKFLHLNLACISEVKARDAHVIVITDCPERLPEEKVDVVIPIPDSGKLKYLNAVVPLQLIAYELSILKGNNPDRPRHLAKTVTVD